MQLAELLELFHVDAGCRRRSWRSQLRLLLLSGTHALLIRILLDGVLFCLLASPFLLLVMANSTCRTGDYRRTNRGSHERAATSSHQHLEFLLLLTRGVSRLPMQQRPPQAPGLLLLRPPVAPQSALRGTRLRSASPP